MTVTVLDVNDNAPQFGSSSYEGRVSENQPTGTTVSLVSSTDNSLSCFRAECTHTHTYTQFPGLVATDADTAPNGVITYTLAGADARYFSLDSQTAELTSRETFDAEMEHTYTDLLVIATDNGGLSSNASLTVIISDENDFSPFFTIPVNTTVLVSEGLSPDATVIVITAADNDIQGNVLNFTLGGVQHGGGSSMNPFMIDSGTGAITVGSGGLDFELSFYYVLTVMVQDSGSPSLSNVTAILVLLSDVNDNAPVFTPRSQHFTVQEHSVIGETALPISFIVSVYECVSQGTVIGRVAVTDADSAELTVLEYMIVGGDEGGRFIINSMTGDIMTAAEIDRESGGETYNLTIEVWVFQTTPQ